MILLNKGSQLTYLLTLVWDDDGNFVTRDGDVPIIDPLRLIAGSRRSPAEAIRAAGGGPTPPIGRLEVAGAAGEEPTPRIEEVTEAMVEESAPPAKRAKTDLEELNKEVAAAAAVSEEVERLLVSTDAAKDRKDPKAVTVTPAEPVGDDQGAATVAPSDPMKIDHRAVTVTPAVQPVEPLRVVAATPAVQLAESLRTVTVKLTRDPSDNPEAEAGAIRTESGAPAEQSRTDTRIVTVLPAGEHGEGRRAVLELPGRDEMNESAPPREGNQIEDYRRVDCTIAGS